MLYEWRVRRESEANKALDGTRSGCSLELRGKLANPLACRLLDEVVCKKLGIRFCRANRLEANHDVILLSSQVHRNIYTYKSVLARPFGKLKSFHGLVPSKAFMTHLFCGNLNLPLKAAKSRTRRDMMTMAAAESLLAARG
jgi:hypothetical protein